MSWLGLRHKGVEFLYPEEWNLVVDGLDILYAYTSELKETTVKFEDLPKLPSDVAPDQDNARELGYEDKAWKDIYAHYGYFIDDAYIQGKRVLKDGDPINIADIYPEARQKITQAIDASTLLGYIKEDVEKAQTPEGYFKVNIVESQVVQNVDAEAIKATESGEIDTSLATPPLTVLAPPSGMRLDIRGIHLATDSTAGEVAAKLAVSGRLVAKLYASRAPQITLEHIRFLSEVNEGLNIEWSKLDPYAKIFWLATYMLK